MCYNILEKVIIVDIPEMGPSVPDEHYSTLLSHEKDSNFVIRMMVLIRKLRGLLSTMFAVSGKESSPTSLSMLSRIAKQA